MIAPKAAITAVGGWVPDKVLSNSDLEKMVDTNDEWITTRTGIKERRIQSAGTGPSETGINSARQILEKKNLDPKEIDLVICATVTPDMQFPATANLITAELGMTNAFGYDISAACSGFLFALNTAAKFIETGSIKKAIVVGADKMSSIVNYNDRATCVIFGDGGGAVLLEADENGFGIQDAILRSDGKGAEFLHMRAGGSAMPLTNHNIDQELQYVHQDGKTVFKFAVTKMADVAEELMQRNKLSGDDISWLCAHQANKRIIDATARRMAVPDEKVMMNIERYGNTTAGTLPLLLWEYENKLKKGDLIMLAAFGGGFTWGATLIKWAY